MESTKQCESSWEHDFPNRLPALMEAIDALIEFLTRHQADPQALYLARLAVEEMGTNILKYGFDDSAEHIITLRVQCQPKSFVLELIDDGHPFDPRQLPEANPDLSLEERQPGGWGISLLRQMLARLDYERRDGRNRLSMRVSRVG